MNAAVVQSPPCGTEMKTTFGIEARTYRARIGRERRHGTRRARFAVRTMPAPKEALEIARAGTARSATARGKRRRHHRDRQASAPSGRSAAPAQAGGCSNRAA